MAGARELLAHEIDVCRQEISTLAQTTRRLHRVLDEGKIVGMFGTLAQKDEFVRALG